MKKIIFELLFFFFSFQISAQITIDGTITDTESNPIENVLVEIFDNNDTSNVFSNITNDKGYFSISTITGNKFIKDKVPKDYIILRNYPNPFNPTTIIYYELPKSEKIEIKVYDILGREIRSLYNNFQKAGIYTVEWNGRNNWNSPVAAGVYFCRLKTKDNFKVNKMILLDGGYASPSVTNSKLNKIQPQILTKVNNVFNYSIKVSGENILDSEFNYLSCLGDTTLNLIVSKILASTTIGPEGGNLATEGFSLSIPEGAFSENETLKLFKAPIDSIDLDNNSVVIGIDGIPLNFLKPIDVFMSRDITDQDTVYIAVGEEHEIPFLSSTDIHYTFMKTIDTLESYKSQLQPYPNYTNNLISKINQSEYQPKKIYFTKKNGYTSIPTNKKNFRIFYKENFNRETLNTLGKNLEKIYDTVKALGFDISNVKYPVEVYVKDFRPNHKKRGCYNWFTFSNGNLCLAVEDDKELIMASNYCIIREYFLGIASTYDKDYYIQFETRVNPSHYWFHHAVGSWIEEKLEPASAIEYYIPMDYRQPGAYEMHEFFRDSGNNFNFPFLGMRAGAENNSYTALRHGGGMSSFIKYIDNNYGIAPILNIYTLIKEDHMYPIEAIKQTLGDSQTWWPDYLEEHMENKLYPFDKSDAFTHWDEYEGDEYIDIVHDEYTFTNKNDTIKSYKEIPFYSLSAKVFKICLGLSKLDSSRIMNINLDNNNCSFILYGYNIENFGNEYKILQRGNSFSSKVKSLLNEGYKDLFIVVINYESNPNYLNLSKLNLEIKLEKPESLPSKAKISLNAHFLMNLHIKDQSGERDVEGVDRVYNDWFGNVELSEGDDSTYYGSWDADDQVGYHHKGNMTVIIDPYTHNLKYFVAEEVQDGDGFTIINEKIRSNVDIDIPTFSTSYTKWNYLIKGTEACSVCSDKSSLEYSKGNDSWNETMTSFSCDGNSSILISLDFDQ